MNSWKAQNWAKYCLKLFSTLLILVASSPTAKAATSFSFGSGSEEWGFWGEGLGVHDPQIGHSAKGSLWMSTDWGENHTASYTWSHLTPGIYKITAYVRAQDVQSDPEGSAFWHFYDVGKGTQSIFTDLKGSFDWRKIEYTVRVTKSLTVWFRLRAPGRVWIDDFEMRSVGIEEKVTIAPERPLKTELLPKIVQESKAVSKIIYTFERGSSEPSHPFSVTRNANNAVGKFTSHDFYNFPISDILSGNWSKFDRLSFDVYNPDHKFYELSTTLCDNRSVNYWSQLNHKTHLAPGWNHLTFDLRQYVGERGSHRFRRSLDLNHLQKFYLVVDPDAKDKARPTFFIDNLALSSYPPPKIPREIMAFDFTSHKAYGPNTFTKVTTQHSYTPERGYGFVEAKFWRVEDSHYASEVLRYSIGVLSGKFLVRVPNGKYQLELILDKLGYWDVPFWKNRTLFANGRPFFKESRAHGTDYIQDLLRFESIDPHVDDHPYDLYLKQILRPIRTTVDVTNNLLELEFEGDPSGISLNSLVIWKDTDQKIADGFLKKNEERNRLEFTWLSRPMDSTKIAKPLSVTTFNIIKPDLLLKPSDDRPAISKSLSFHGGVGEKSYQVIQVKGPNNTEISWNISDFKGPSGQTISGDSLKLSEVMYQYTSPDLNHETYMLAGKFLKPLKQSLLKFEAAETKFLWFDFQINRNHLPGNYKGEITFVTKQETKKIPIEIQIRAYELPKVDFPVGFFGLDPIAYTYFESDDIERVRTQYRLTALNVLAEAGFTTFTGLPSAKIEKEGDVWTLNTSELDKLFDATKNLGMTSYVFSYGGQFPQNLLDESQKPWDMSSETYHKKMSSLLEQTLKLKNWPKLVHTFSDEAGGYSDKLQQDAELGKKLKSRYPFLLLGGFGTLSQEARQLNSMFEYGFFSNVDRRFLNVSSEKSKWGTYNASPGNLHDPRFSFGPGLFMAREAGLSQYLEWHSSAFNNYPYYDLDGRESDVSMFVPSKEGSLYLAIRFELAREGLQAFRKLKLLQYKLSKNPQANKQVKEWMERFEKNNNFFSRTNFLQKRDFDFEKFSNELDRHLIHVTAN